MATRNNILRKQANSKWGTNDSTIRTTLLAVRMLIGRRIYNTSNPVWSRSKHALHGDHRIPEANCKGLASQNCTIGYQKRCVCKNGTMNNTPCLIIYMQQTAWKHGAVAYFQLKHKIQ